MTILVLGSGGMVGSSIVRAYKEKGMTVISPSKQDLNLLDANQTEEFFKSCRPKLVIAAAARVGGISANSKKPVEFISSNLQIQINLMKSAFVANVERLVFLGSSCIYPRECPQPIKEEFLMTGTLEPSNSAYAMAKLAGLEMIQSYRKEYGLNWISIMPTNLYGPGDNFSLSESHVLPALIRRFVEAVDNDAEEIILWGTGTPLRDFLHVDDLASAVLMASEKYNDSLHLNVGSGDGISISDLANLVSKASGFKGQIKWDHAQPDGTPRKVLDISRISSLGWKPTIALDDGISSTMTWFREAVKEGVARL